MLPHTVLGGAALLFGATGSAFPFGASKPGSDINRPPPPEHYSKPYKIPPGFVGPRAESTDHPTGSDSGNQETGSTRKYRTLPFSPSTDTETSQENSLVGKGGLVASSSVNTHQNVPTPGQGPANGHIDYHHRPPPPDIRKTPTGGAQQEKDVHGQEQQEEEHHQLLARAEREAVQESSMEEMPHRSMASGLESKEKVEAYVIGIHPPDHRGPREESTAKTAGVTLVESVQDFEHAEITIRPNKDRPVDLRKVPPPLGHDLINLRQGPPHIDQDLINLHQGPPPLNNKNDNNKPSNTLFRTLVVPTKVAAKVMLNARQQETDHSWQ
ncbi:MAG: hypothetical protein Q9190_007330, partial [Brigantiaea leucoxantha]